MTAAQVEQFHELGYVVIPDLFKHQDLEPIRREIAELVSNTARRLFDEGLISEIRDSEPFEMQLAKLVEDHPECWDVFRKDIEGKAGGGHTGRAMFDLLTHPSLLDAMERLVGEEIIASSVYRIRPKLPRNVRGEIPWHQDSGYFATHCDARLIVTCWIPLVEATIENGCLMVLPRSHRHGVVTHKTGTAGGYLVIQPNDLPLQEDEAVYVPVPLGGALLMTNLTAHCSRENTTEQVRWSVDLRYQSRDVPTNAFQDPSDYAPDAPDIERACYPPEGDFVVRSVKHPEQVATYENFQLRRSLYENARLPFPGRGWQPVNSEPVASE